LNGVYPARTDHFNPASSCGETSSIYKRFSGHGDMAGAR
jgi:hypothetical protein